MEHDNDQILSGVCVHAAPVRRRTQVHVAGNELRHNYHHDASGRHLARSWMDVDRLGAIPWIVALPESPLAARKACVWHSRRSNLLWFFCPEISSLAADVSRSYSRLGTFPGGYTLSAPSLILN